MLIIMEYNRAHAVEYALRWALGRNPLFESYNGIGGDCTNFVSQCLYAGSCTMNYTRDFGWYYISPTSRAPAWTGVQFFYNFITENSSVGPFGHETYPGGLDVGDVIQLGNENGDFYHSVVVTGASDGVYLVSAHSNDALNRPLDTYTYATARFIKIDGVRQTLPDNNACFDKFLSGESL